MSEERSGKVGQEGGPVAVPSTRTAGTSSEHEYPSLKSVAAGLISVYLAAFIISLDRTIISTAVPKITDDFHSLNDVGWYGSAYLLPLCCFQLLFGRLYNFYSSKRLFLFCFALFEAGSFICGIAPNSIALIMGRAIAGIGAGGAYSGTFFIIIQSVPLRQRPLFQAGLGMMIGICSILGPLVGGAFTEQVTWRWCFYVNLPIGAVSFVLVIFAYHPQPIAKKEMPITEKIARLDPVGTIFFMAGTICLLLALQWGGSTYAWKNARIIVLFILTGILLVAWLFVESRNPGTAIVPPRISLQRTVLSAMINSFFIGGSFMTLIYYLPIWFQSIKGANPLKSGVMTIAMIVPQVIASVVGAKTVQVTGYYNPWIYAGSILTSIGSGLFITFTPTTAHPKWIGYQVIYGLGLGCGFQQGTLAVQNTLSGPDVNIGVSIIILSLTLSGSIFVSVGQTLFSNTLAHHLSNIYGIDAEAIVNAGATAIRDIVPASKLSEVLVAYNAGIVAVFKLNTILACLSMIGAIGIEWKSLKREKAIEDKTEKAEEGLGDKAITRVGPTDRDGVTPLVAPTMVSEGDDESELDKEEYEEKQSRN